MNQHQKLPQIIIRTPYPNLPVRSRDPRIGTGPNKIEKFRTCVGLEIFEKSRIGPGPRKSWITSDLAVREFLVGNKFDDPLSCQNLMFVSDHDNYGNLPHRVY